MNSEKVAVIVVNYKGIEDTKDSIASLLSQSYPHLKIVVVENGSHDESVNEIKKLEQQHSKNLVALYNKTNTGFTGGVNTGIQWAMKNNYPYVALFNNDAVADTKWLEELMNGMKKSDSYGIVTGLLLHEDGKTIDTTGEQYSTWGLAFPRNRDDKTEAAPKKPEEVLGATGGATLYRAKMLERIGIFDAVLFAYYEDIDISFRAQLAGWKVYYTPKAVAYHKQGATSRRMPSGFAVRQTFKNLPVVFTKNVPASLLLSMGFRFYFAYFLMIGNALKSGNGKAAFLGLWQSIMLAPHSLKERRRIQQAKKVPTSYIKSLLWPDLPPNQTGVRRVRKFFTGKP
jgi:GT2 family glycosyltransferase